MAQGGINPALTDVYGKMEKKIGDRPQDEHGHLMGYIHGLQDAGLPFNDAQKYLYYYLAQIDQAKGKLPTGKGTKEQVLEGAWAQTDPGSQGTAPGGFGQLAQNYAQSKTGQQAAKTYAAQGGVAQVYADAQASLLSTLSLADQQDYYLANKGKKGVTSPLTADNETASALGLEHGEGVTGDTIRHQAWMNYFDTTGQWGYGGSEPVDPTGQPQATAPRPMEPWNPQSGWHALMQNLVAENTWKNQLAQIMGGNPDTGVGPQYPGGFDPVRFFQAMQSGQLPGAKVKERGGGGTNQTLANIAAAGGMTQDSSGNWVPMGTYDPNNPPPPAY
jgi:hypothetical protein